MIEGAAAVGACTVHGGPPIIIPAALTVCPRPLCWMAQFLLTICRRPLCWAAPFLASVVLGGPVSPRNSRRRAARGEIRGRGWGYELLEVWARAQNFEVRAGLKAAQHAPPGKQTALARL